MPSVLFLTLHRPNRSPSQRFRFEQYLSFLEASDFNCSWSYLLDEEADKYFYQKGNYFRKFKILANSFFKRISEITSSKHFDIVFIQRECFMLGTTFFENQFSKKSKIIFDFDDSIWLQNVSNANKTLAFLKNANKTASIIQISDMVFVGNQYLANYATQFNSNVRIVPTTINTNEYQRKIVEKPNDAVCIGWSGSITTIQHFEQAIPALEIIKEKYKKKVYFQVIGDNQYRNINLGIKGISWNKKTELEDLSQIDIGLMPLPDDEWAKGKCGLKGLQYMALEIATIMSPVGVNTEIIQHGNNGFLATTRQEWVDCISNLIENKELRKQVGVKGRQTVLAKYSVETNKSLYLNYFKEILK